MPSPAMSGPPQKAVPEYDTAPFPRSSYESGFTPLELETIHRILYRMALRLQQENNNETLPEKGTLPGTVQPVRHPDHSAKRKGRDIRQTVHYQSGEK